MTEIELVGIDLDGTLVMPDGTVSERNIRAVRQAMERGVTVAIVTGRPHVSAEQFVSDLGLQSVPIISFNGAVIRRPGQTEALAERKVSANTASRVVRYAIADRYHLHYYLKDVMYVPRVSYPARLYYQRTGVEPVPAGDMRKFDGKRPIKLLICVPPEQRDAVLCESRDIFGDELNITPSMPEYIEYLSADVSKGRALHWLAEYLGVSPEATMGIGDMGNDLDLLEASGTGVAMPHADGQVKAAASYIADSKAEGVAEALDKFLMTQEHSIDD